MSPNSNPKNVEKNEPSCTLKWISKTTFLNLSFPLTATCKNSSPKNVDSSPKDVWLLNFEKWGVVLAPNPCSYPLLKQKYNKRLKILQKVAEILG